MTINKDEFEKAVEEANKRSTEGIKKSNEELRQKEIQEDILEANRKSRLGYQNWLQDQRGKHIASRDKEGNVQTLWDNVNQHADKVIHSGQEAYNDWRSNMMQLLTLLTELVEAINVSTEQVLVEGMDRAHLNEVIKQGMYIPLKEKLFHAIKGQGEVSIPKLQQNVNFEDGKGVVISPVTRADGTSFGQKSGEIVNDAFHNLVDLWLLENGYKPVANKPGEYISTVDSSPLTKQAFNDLKRDHSLQDFLDARADLTYESSRMAPG